MSNASGAPCLSSDVRRTLRGALLGLEIGSSQSTLPVGAGQYGRTPHIALSGAFLALGASDCNGWPRRWVSGRRRDWDPGSAGLDGGQTGVWFSSVSCMMRLAAFRSFLATRRLLD